LFTDLAGEKEPAERGQNLEVDQMRGDDCVRRRDRLGRPNPSVTSIDENVDGRRRVKDDP
jgi:hypothetical protein